MMVKGFLLTNYTNIKRSLVDHLIRVQLILVKLIVSEVSTIINQKVSGI